MELVQQEGLLVEDCSDKKITDNSPGMLLARAREKLGMSQEQVAESLRLTVDKIKHIEGDDFHYFPALIFIRGYLRSYARIVEVSEDEIIGVFDRLEIKDPAPSLVPPVQQAPRERSFQNENMVRWMTYFVMGVLVFLLGLWWHNQRSDDLLASNTLETPTLQTADAALNGEMTEGADLAAVGPDTPTNTASVAVPTPTAIEKAPEQAPKLAEVPKPVAPAPDVAVAKPVQPATNPVHHAKKHIPRHHPRVAQAPQDDSYDEGSSPLF